MHTVGAVFLGVDAYLVGSSKNITGGLLTSSRAMASLLHCPPDREMVRVCAHSCSPRAVRISFTCSTHTHTHRHAHRAVHRQTDIGQAD